MTTPQTEFRSKIIKVLAVATESESKYYLLRGLNNSKLLSSASDYLIKGLNLSQTGSSWVYENVIPEYILWVNEARGGGGPTSPTTITRTSGNINSRFGAPNKDHVSGIAMCKGVSTIRGFENRIHRELNPPTVRSTLALRPLSLLFPSQILGTDAYFRVVPIAGILHNQDRHEAVEHEAKFTLPTGEIVFGLGVYVETLHLAFLGAGIDILKRFLDENKSRVEFSEKRFGPFSFARTSCVTNIFHNKCILMAIERAINSVERGVVLVEDEENANTENIGKKCGIDFAETPVSLAALFVVFKTIQQAIILSL